MARNFLKSMFLLGVAMVAALYANGSARDGRIGPAAAGTVLAMSIALWVAVRFVPRLAAGVDWDWLPFFTRYRVTRDGWVYIAGTVIVLFAAINTSNNLLYMILSALIAVMILSGVLSALNFRFLKVTAKLPDHCFAGRPFPVTMTLENSKWVFPTFSLNMRAVDGSSFAFQPYYVPVLRTRDTETWTTEVTLPRRGQYGLEEIEAQSRYPFGFIVKGRHLALEGECVAFPKISPPEELETSFNDLLGSEERFERGQGTDLYMLRDYLASDSARHVDWKASAKASALKVREFAAEENRKLTLYFDRYGEAGDNDRFEELVSRAASLAVHLHEAGVDAALVSDNWSSPRNASDPGLQSILYYLALVEMTPNPDPLGGMGPKALLFSLRRGAEGLSRTHDSGAGVG